MSAIRVRPAALEDAALVLDFIRQLAAYEKLSDQVVATEAAVRETLFGPRPAAEALIAELDGAPAGFALFFQNYSTFLARPGLYLEDLFVIPALRRHGVGRALFTHLARLAVERQCGRFEWAVLDWNEPAIAFYKSLGAVPLHDWTVFRLTGDALIAAGQQR
jgi:GNAT superfamily N-acetyltransferase